MRWSDLPLNPSDRTVREFAGLWCVVVGALAAWHGLVQENGSLGVIVGLVASLGPVGLLFPRAARPVFVTWVVVAFPIGWVVSRLLVVVLFFGLVTPVALL